MSAEDGRRPRPGATPASWPDPSLGGRSEPTVGVCEVCGDPAPVETVPYCARCDAMTPGRRVAFAMDRLLARLRRGPSKPLTGDAGPGYGDTMTTNEIVRWVPRGDAARRLPAYGIGVVPGVGEALRAAMAAEDADRLRSLATGETLSCSTCGRPYTGDQWAHMRATGHYPTQPGDEHLGGIENALDRARLRPDPIRDRIRGKR